MDEQFARKKKTGLIFGGEFMFSDMIKPQRPD